MEELLLLEGPALKFVAASHSQLAFQLTLVSEHLRYIYIYTIQRIVKLPSNKGPLKVK